MEDNTQVNPTDDQQVTTPTLGEETAQSEEAMPKVNETEGETPEETAPEANSDEAANQ